MLYENSIVKEALRRIPKDVYHERQFRLARAIDLSAKQKCLPREEWTKKEDVTIFSFLL